MRHKKNHRKFFTFLSAGALLLLVPGCSDPGTAGVTKSVIQEITPASPNGINVGWSVYTLENDFFKRMDKSLKEDASSLGITLLTHNQNNDPEEMLRGCKSLIAQDIDALVVSPCYPGYMEEIVDLSHEKNIPIVIVDIGDGGSDKDALIVSDCTAGGETVAEYALSLLKDNPDHTKEMAVLKCESSAVYANRRGDAFISKVTDAGYKISAVEYANSDEDLAYTKTKKMILYHPDITALFAENDPMALGASRALKEAGKKDVLVFGFDGSQQAVNAIVEGDMSGTMLQDSEKMGKLGLETALQLLNEEVPAFDEPENKVIYTGGYLIGKDGEMVHKNK
ncbi:substrate-binding domain-containing protein [uncultured Robinsoniella sp.]|uniref:substrate-binding domain-containing protein n=1 Tax=uncultured Robinsoniella sp. TaxID=904190 RepID=UPI00374F8911